MGNVAAPNTEEGLWTTKEAAAWLKTSPRKLETSRIKGDGPPFIRISSRMVRYRPQDVRAWVSSIRCTGNV